MSIVDVSIEQASMARAYNLLRHINGGFPRTVAAAVNRTLESMKTETVRETQEKYFVKPGEIRKTLKLRKASAGNFQGTMFSKGGRRKLSNYQLTPRRPQTGRKNVFQGAVKRAGGLKTLPEDTFMMNTPNAGYVLFRRVRPGRRWQNITHVHSPAIPQIIKNKETVLTVEKKTQEVFERRLNHEVFRMLKLTP